jgi:peptidoglycan lytic transglycosylase
MRRLLPTVAAAATIAVGSGAAYAAPAQSSPVARAASHVSLHLSRHSLLAGRGAVLKGRVQPGGARRVKVVVRGPRGAVIHSATKPSGAFALRWSPSRVGAYSVRAYGIHDRHTRGSTSVARRLTAYRPAAASYYGPGLYGGALACGGTLQPGTLGVANKTLPCGSRVRLRYRGRTVTVQVVDRGPYVAGRDFDLTAATKARLRFPDVGVLLSSR